MSQPIKCRAALLYKEGQPMVVEDVLVPPPGDGQVLVKMVSAGICASDGHYVWGSMKANEYGHLLPLILGHEGAGIVESVGPGVFDIKPGDHVLTTFIPLCQKCYGCQMSNVCFVNTFVNMGSRPTHTLVKNGNPVYSFCAIGAFSEYITVDRAIVVKINDKVNLEHSATISCSIATGFYSAINLAKVKSGSVCAVWGIGAVGVNVIQGCKFNGAKHIIAVDINPSKRDMAMKFGATEFVNPKELDCPLEKYFFEKFQVGIDFAFDCFGSQTIIDQALKSLSPFGTFVMVGLPSETTKIVYPARELFMGKTIISGLLGGKKPDCYNELVDLYMKNQIKLDELITHKFKLDQINEAFQTLKEGKCIRSLITFS